MIQFTRHASRSTSVINLHISHGDACICKTLKFKPWPYLVFVPQTVAQSIQEVLEDKCRGKNKSSDISCTYIWKLYIKRVINQAPCNVFLFEKEMCIDIECRTRRILFISFTNHSWSQSFFEERTHYFKKDVQFDQMLTVCTNKATMQQ